MTGMVFLGLGSTMVLLMVLMFSLLSKQKEAESSGETPLESGFATTGRVFGVFSLQFLIVLILFLILDLEVIFVIALVFSGGETGVKSIIFVLFIIGSLWAEWAWGKLFWAV